jgi:hypothetical protein
MNYTICYIVKSVSLPQLARVISEIENETGMTPISVHDGDGESIPATKYLHIDDLPLIPEEE